MQGDQLPFLVRIAPFERGQIADRGRRLSAQTFNLDVTIEEGGTTIGHQEQGRRLFVRIHRHGGTAPAGCGITLRAQARQGRILRRRPIGLFERLAFWQIPILLQRLHQLLSAGLIARQTGVQLPFKQNLDFAHMSSGPRIDPKQDHHGLTALGICHTGGNLGSEVAFRFEQSTSLLRRGHHQSTQLHQIDAVCVVLLFLLKARQVQVGS